MHVLVPCGVVLVRVPNLIGNKYPGEKKGSDPVRKGLPIWNFGISGNFILFRQSSVIWWGKKCTALLQTHNWEKSIFQRSCMCICTDTRKYLTGEVGASRVNDKIWLFLIPSSTCPLSKGVLAWSLDKRITEHKIAAVTIGTKVPSFDFSLLKISRY